MEYENFEKAFEHLNKIVKDFEDADNLSLENILKNYEEGMLAYSYCIKNLEDTQRKIKIIDSKFE